MPNSNNAQNTPKTYDASDVADIYSEASEFTEWLSTMIGQIRKESNEIKAKLSLYYKVDDCHFYTIDKLLDLSEFMADGRVADFERLHKEYKQEWEVNKKAVTL